MFHNRIEYFVCPMLKQSGLLLLFPVIQTATYPKITENKRSLVSIRCEQSTKGGNGLDVWLGRLAMVGFAAAISVEIATGKGLLEVWHLQVYIYVYIYLLLHLQLHILILLYLRLQNFGLTTPLPTVALAVTALVGVLTAIFIFQSAPES